MLHKIQHSDIISIFLKQPAGFLKDLALRIRCDRITVHLDDVWNNIVAEIGGLSNDTEETLEQQIINREEREKLLKQIEALEKRCRIEKQKHKKYELHQQLLKLKELL